MLSRGRGLKKKASSVQEGMYPNKPIADNPTHDRPSLLKNPSRIDLITWLRDLHVYRVGMLTNSALNFRDIFSPAV